MGCGELACCSSVDVSMGMHFLDNYIVYSIQKEDFLRALRGVKEKLSLSLVSRASIYYFL